MKTYQWRNWEYNHPILPIQSIYIQVYMARCYTPPLVLEYILLLGNLSRFHMFRDCRLFYPNIDICFSLELQLASQMYRYIVHHKPTMLSKQPMLDMH